jgi:hypothetical protein
MRESTASESVKNQPEQENILTPFKNPKKLRLSQRQRILSTSIPTFSYGGLVCMLADSVVSFP